MRVRNIFKDMLESQQNEGVKKRLAYYHTNSTIDVDFVKIKQNVSLKFSGLDHDFILTDIKNI